MNIDRDKINSAITIATLFVSALAFWVSYKSYELSNLKPLFEIGICSHDEYQMNQKYRIIKNNETSYIDLYGQKGGGEFSSHKDLKNDYIIDITRPPSEIHFYIKNIGKVSAENTKIIFDFNGMSLNPDYKEGNVDKGPLEERHFVWEYRPLYPIMEKSYCEMHWVDKDIMYPDIKREFSYSFGDSILDNKNPYIDIKIVSKTSVLQKMRINVRYHDISEYGKGWPDK